MKYSNILSVIASLTCLSSAATISTSLPGVTSTGAFVVRIQTYATQLPSGTSTGVSPTGTSNSALFRIIDTSVEENDSDESINSTSNVCYDSNTDVFTLSNSKLIDFVGPVASFDSNYELQYPNQDVFEGPTGFSLISGEYLAFGQDTDFLICGLVEKTDGYTYANIYHKSLITTPGCVFGKIRVFFTTTAACTA